MEQARTRDLGEDIHLLGDILGRTLQSHGGAHLFEVVETMRHAAKRAREAEEERSEAHRTACAALANTARELSADLAMEVVRAFTLYFQLINVAEDVHRTRVLRRRLIEGGEASVAESFAAVLGELSDAGFDEQTILHASRDLQLGFVFTAHPTEARRRTTERLLASVRTSLESMDRQAHTPIEGRRLHRALQSHIEALWQHAAERDEKPEVIDEVKAGLWYVRHILFDVMPRLERRFAHAFMQRFGERDPLSLPAMVSFGSWMGGDRDGNPFVTDAVTERTLELHRWIATDRYLGDLDALVDPLSCTSHRIALTPAFEEALRRAYAAVPEVVHSAKQRNPREPLRHFISLMRERVARARTFSAGGYPGAKDFYDDLVVVRDTLLSAHASGLANDALLDLIYRVRVFGFHLVPLDLREDSREHRRAVGELLGVSNYEQLASAERIRALERLSPASLERRKVSQETRRVVSSFATMARCQARFGAEALSTYIISMTEHPSDVLEVFALLRAFRIAANVDIVPLFETWAALEGAEECLEQLFDYADYRVHLSERHNTQEILVGYSDSMKENGILASRTMILEVQERLTQLGNRHQVKLRFFHGRGGSVSRGGGPTYRALRALPAHIFSGQTRITEQGETRSYHFANPDLAIRYLEQAVGASLALRCEARHCEARHCEAVRGEAAKPPQRPANASPTHAEQNEHRALRQRLAATSRSAYRALVSRPELVDFFEEATPFEAITEMQIASRPSKRKGQRSGLADLRAIPWVFAWAQARTLMTAWYGVGHALAAATQEGISLDALRDLYRRDRFFRDVIDNVQMTLAKADLDIAERYAELCRKPETRAAIFPEILREFEQTCRYVLETSGHKRLLEDDAVVRKSIRLRNPYVDPMSYIQVEALARARATTQEAERAQWMRVARVAVQGIAAGLRNTG